MRALDHVVGQPARPERAAVAHALAHQVGRVAELAPVLPEGLGDRPVMTRLLALQSEGHQAGDRVVAAHGALSRARGRGGHGLKRAGGLGRVVGQEGVVR